MSTDSLDRRNFLQVTGGLSASVAFAAKGFAKTADKLNPSA